MRLLFATLGLFALAAFAAEVMPPAPERFFNDYAGIVSKSTAANLDHQLEEFEHATSSQILVVIFPRMQSDSSVEDYTVRIAQSWRVGQKAKDNGAVLFVFSQDRKLFLQVGYGLEGALPDARCKQIIEREITPRFKAGDFDGGLTAGVTAILAATRGEYKATGQTARRKSVPFPLFLIGIFLVFAVISRVFGRKRGTMYRRGGYSGYGGWIGGGGWGGGSSGGGGGFSGGGGSFGGGGAGGSW